MKQTIARWFASIALFVVAPLCIFAQDTSFTYQGRLNVGSAPANGSYDLRCALYDASVGGVQQGGLLTLNAVVVSNGLFTAILDFGNVATGGKLWLELGVRTNGGGGFTTLSPRQALTPTPYATFAYTASNLSGTLPVGSVTAAQLAPGASLSNLTASGQSAVPSGGIILSQTYYDSNLVNAGYQKLGRVDLTETWEKRASAAVAGRENHTAVWTGNELIIWGGNNSSSLLITGARYNPLANTWQTISTNNAPSARIGQSAVWTGTEMIVWGGSSNFTLFATGARYDPVADKWSPMNDTGAPLGRADHTAIWTGTEMIIWGGTSNNTTYYSKGARYNPLLDTWSPLNNTGEPSGRAGHTAVWTGTEMIIWGGYDGTNIVSTGGRYSPATNSWSATTSLFSPGALTGHSAIWTGSEMIIWGGYGGAYVNNCVGYFPSTNAWFIHGNLNAPSARGDHFAFWTGSEMLIWGGHDLSTTFNNGGRFNLQSGIWSSISTNGAPSPRTARAVWTGGDMLVNDGYASIYWNETYSYTPPRVGYLYQRP